MTSDCGNTLSTRRMVLRVNETLMREADATTTDDYRAFLRSLPEAIGLEDN